MVKEKELLLYLHTHWDREWYWSFGAYRTQLVQVVQSIVEKLESGELSNFMLDGQTCLIEDLTEMAPALASRLPELVAKNLLAIGPWYVLADQLLVGGESLVRNLELGMALCKPLGKASMIGYCPDTFGHSADLPRILQGFGIDNAVVWRGVPAMSGGPLFLWQSADGSEVLADQLARGYYQTAFHEGVSEAQLADYLLSFLGLERDPEEKSLVETTSSSLVYSSEMKAALVPVGGDHLRPPSEFKAQLQDALTLAQEFTKGETLTARAVSLETFFEKAKEDLAADISPLQLVQGELRDNATAFACERAYMLAGVLSTRLYLKRENRLMEHALVKRAQPFRALLAMAGILPYPHEEFKHCWKLLLKNHPHDSICGCSIDEVHDEMQARTKSLAGQLAVLSRQGQEALIKHLTPELAEVRLGLNNMTALDPAQKPTALIAVNGAGQTLSMPVPVRLCLESGSPVPDGLQVVRQKKISEAFLELSAVPQFKNVDLIDAFTFVENVAPMSIKSLPSASSAFDHRSAMATSIKSGFSSGFDDIALQNQFFTLYLDKKGQLLVKEKHASRDHTLHQLNHRLLDTGDGGDTYNFDPVAHDKPIEASVVAVKRGMEGPLVASILVEYEIDLPACLKEEKGNILKRKGESETSPGLSQLKRSNKKIKHKIITEITLKANVPIVFFDTRFKNKAADHRLEVIFSTGKKLNKTLSENHYSVIERPLSKKADLHPLYDGDAIIPLGHEAPLDRYPCQRFFLANNQCFLNTGLPEYGAAGREVSITLLRAVSYLSRNRLRTRGGGAGPNIETPGANCFGKNHLSYGWAPLKRKDADTGDSDIQNYSQAYSLAEIYEEPLIAYLGPESTVPKSESLFHIDNDSIKIMASFIDEAGKMTLRLLNVSSSEQSVSLQSSGVVSLHKLDGSEVKAIKSTRKNEIPAAIKFKPWQLITVKITDVD